MANNQIFLILTETLLLHRSIEQQHFCDKLCVEVGENTTIKDRRFWSKLFLSALVPLMIGIFTVITTIQQQKLSTLQRQHGQTRGTSF